MAWHPGFLAEMAEVATRVESANVREKNWASVTLEPRVTRRKTYIDIYTVFAMISDETVFV